MYHPTDTSDRLLTCHQRRKKKCQKRSPKFCAICTKCNNFYKGSKPSRCMAKDVIPAILREWCANDRSAVVRRTPYNGVTFTRGYGESGYKVQTVEHDCPECRFDRMVRRHDVHAESPDMVRYWCLNPNCMYYVSDYLSHACHGSYPQHSPQEPAVMEERQA